MLKTIQTFLSTALVLSLASCATNSPDLRDELGHRQGPKSFKTIILDAGHGGKDSGAISRHTGTNEKDLTLDMAKRLRRELGSSFRVVLLRDDDTFIELDDRVKLTNRHGDAVLVSVHFNSGPSFIRGPETYYWRVDSHGLAVRLQQAMTATSPSEQANRGLVRRRLRLTRNPEIPCVLIECGYLSHPSESRLVDSPDYRQKMAASIASAIRMQSAIGDEGTGPLPRPLYAPPSRASDRPE